MVSLSQLCRVPRPKHFLFVMSLRVGVEMISLTMLFNKISGFFGLLAVLTGYHLNPTQISMYIYSVIALVLTAYLMAHIRKQSPFECLALAWLYIVDMLVNAAYTIAFGVMWFRAVSSGRTNTMSGASEQIMSGYTDGTASSSVGIGAPGTPFIPESIPSILLIAALTLVRVYFCLVVMAYARQVLRQHVYVNQSMNTFPPTEGLDNLEDVAAEDPFAATKPEGQGWKGKLGRLMVGIGRAYWLGGRMEMDEEWARTVDGRFRTGKTADHASGTLERERRARSGTGPPKPAPELTAAA